MRFMPFRHTVRIVGIFGLSRKGAENLFGDSQIWELKK
jgi:hypothetical protein